MGEEDEVPGSTVTGSTEREVASQPGCWRRAAALAAEVAGSLPASGERVAVAGCGTSWFMAQSYAAAREAAGQGETDAFTASEMPLRRRYDRVLVLSRSGTTTEILQLLGRLRGIVPTVAVTADAATPVAGAADAVIELAFADERSVVQTRFATTELALLLAHLGQDIGPAAEAAERVLAEPLPAKMMSARQFTFLGTGWT
jgi:fructoselysine-6-P-deglycase FrlB-like protein